jgi:transketolase
MINENQKLNPKVLDKKNVEQEPIRMGFGRGLLAAGEKNSNVVGLCADLTTSTQMNLFKNKFPNRFIQTGIAEQNQASVAAGLSMMGKIPFFSSYSMFSPGRNWEQIRTCICYNDAPAVVVGSHAGVSVGPDGGTHQAIEDIALMRILPRMNVICPCDSVEAEKVTMYAAEMGKAVFIRLAREKTPIMTTKETPFEFGKAQLWYGDADKADVALIGIGALLHKCLFVAEELKKEGVSAQVWNFATVKPLDEKMLLGVAKNVGAVVTVEEHQIAGGMGSAIAEFMSANAPTPIEFIGIKDMYGQTGQPDELLEHYEMGETHILSACKKVIARK